VSAGASAPGKLLLSGEYAVLEGAPAVVVAVQTRAVARFVSGPPEGPEHPEGASARRLTEARFGPVPARLTVDASALRSSGDVKLGLGSSAALAAACAGAVAVYHGRDPSDPSAGVLELALAGHRAVAPEGSGADVAASVLGGSIRFRRLGAMRSRSATDSNLGAMRSRSATDSNLGADSRGDRVDARPLPLPEDLALRVVWTGQAARTSDFLRKVAGLAEAAPAAHRARMDALADGAERLADAFARGDAASVVREAGAYGEAMRALGEAAGVPIVEAKLEALDALARRFGGRAKPSGAGGGDVGIAFFAGREPREAFDRACRDAGLLPLELALGGPGVLPEPS
jgi:phosphomevalonate kinase